MQSFSFRFLLNVCTIVFTEWVYFHGWHGDKYFFVDRLTKKLASINILCVKLFQAIALNNQYIDQKMNNTLLKFTDHAPWTTEDIDYETLLKLETEEGLVFCDDPLNSTASASASVVPINAGMISLVFRARRKADQTRMIVKMKRRDIDRKLQLAIEDIVFLLQIVSLLIPAVSQYQLAEVVYKNIDIIKHQINFETEVQNMMRMKRNCQNLQYVKIPNVCKEITDAHPSVILMEEIVGVSINELQEEDFAPFAKLVIKFGIVTTLIHGVTHGDLHSGNILFIKEMATSAHHPHPHPRYKLGILDFGIVYEVDSKYKSCMFDIFTEIFVDSPKKSATRIISMGWIEPVDAVARLPKHDYETIVDFLSAAIQESVFDPGSSKQCANQVQIYKLMHTLNTYMSKPEIASLGLRPSDEFVKTQLVLAMSQGVTLTLCKNNYMSLADEVLNELFHTDILF